MELFKALNNNRIYHISFNKERCTEIILSKLRIREHTRDKTRHKYKLHNDIRNQIYVRMKFCNSTINVKISFNLPYNRF